MAQIREVRLIDDLDGEAADETVEFGLDGKVFEIDLSQGNAGRLRDALAEFVAAARKSGGGAGAVRPAAGRRRPGGLRSIASRTRRSGTGRASAE